MNSNILKHGVVSRRGDQHPSSHGAVNAQCELLPPWQRCEASTAATTELLRLRQPAGVMPTPSVYVANGSAVLCRHCNGLHSVLAGACRRCQAMLRRLVPAVFGAEPKVKVQHLPSPAAAVQQITTPGLPGDLDTAIWPATARVSARIARDPRHAT